MKRSFLAALLLIFLAGLLTGFSTGSYEISGEVADETGEGIPGVRLLIRSGDNEAVVVTDEYGYWTAEVPDAGDAVIEPEKEGYIFWPQRQQVTNEDAGADNVDFWGVTNKLAGRVVINGQPANRPIYISVETSEGTEPLSYKSNSRGEYALPLEDFEDLEWIRVIVAAWESFSSSQIGRMDLIAEVIIENPPLETRFLPDIDLYSYGLELLAPEDNDTVAWYPYDVRISVYDRDVDDLYYRLYFHDLSHEVIGHSAVSFTDDTFVFDGTLKEGGALGREDTIWYLSAFFRSGDIQIRVNTESFLVFGDY